MKRLLVLSIAALTLGALAPIAHATGVTSSGGVAGTECGATGLFEHAAAGVLSPGESDWYDASYTDGGARDIKLRPGFVPLTSSPFDSFAIAQFKVRVYEWDQATNTCVEIDSTTCSWSPDGICFTAENFWGWVTQPGPGSYQIEVERPAWNDLPNAYTLTVE